MGFRQCDIQLSKEQSVTPKITIVLAKGQISLQDNILGYQNDLHFTEYILAIEVNGKNHTDRLKTIEEREKKT